MFETFKTLVLALTLAASSNLMAAQLEINWNNPETFKRNHPSGNESKNASDANLEKSMERHLLNQSKHLPEDQKLVMNFTEFTLAGSVVLGPNGQRVRVVKNNTNPARISFSYQVLDNAGKTLLEGEENLRSKSTRMTRQHTSYAVEKDMLDSWFKSTFK